MPRLPRWCHRVYAWFAGYFWLPCPVCGQMFGGHEWVAGDLVYVLEDYRPRATCPRPVCRATAQIDRWFVHQRSTEHAIYWLSTEGIQRVPPTV